MSVKILQSNLLDDVEDLHGKQKERKDGLTVSPLIKLFCLRIKLNPSKINDLDSGQHICSWRRMIHPIALYDPLKSIQRHVKLTIHQ